MRDLYYAWIVDDITLVGQIWLFLLVQYCILPGAVWCDAKYTFSHTHQQLNGQWLRLNPYPHDHHADYAADKDSYPYDRNMSVKLGSFINFVFSLFCVLLLFMSNLFTLHFLNHFRYKNK